MKKKKDKFEFRRGAYLIKVPEKHIGARMLFPISLATNLFEMGPESRIMLALDSHPKSQRQIKEIIVIYEDKTKLITGGKISLKKIRSLWNSISDSPHARQRKKANRRKKLAHKPLLHLT